MDRAASICGNRGSAVYVRNVKCSIGFGGVDMEEGKKYNREEVVMLLNIQCAQKYVYYIEIFKQTKQMDEIYLNC
jgi:hypothetical protein